MLVQRVKPEFLLFAVAELETRAESEVEFYRRCGQIAQRYPTSEGELTGEFLRRVAEAGEPGTASLLAFCAEELIGEDEVMALVQLTELFWGLRLFDELPN